MHQSELIRKLLEPAAYPHSVHDLQVIETHISWVILTGEYAYKVSSIFLPWSSASFSVKKNCESIDVPRRNFIWILFPSE